MRTKTTLVAAAILAAGLASSMAQNVYSLNVVGYVNVTVVGGGAYNLLANPLNSQAVGGNTLDNIFPPGSGPADFDSVLKWDVATYDFIATQPYYGSGAWVGTVNLNVGEGFFYVNANSTFTKTFVGEVVQGNFANTLIGAGAYNCIGSSAPIGGSYANSIVGLVPGDFDSILKWDVATYDFDLNQPYFGSGVWNDSGPLTINAGEGFFYVNANADNPWVRNFVVP